MPSNFHICINEEGSLFKFFDLFEIQKISMNRYYTYCRFLSGSSCPGKPIEARANELAKVLGYVHVLHLSHALDMEGLGTRLPN